MIRRNLITDVAGIRVGNAHDERLCSGVTVLLADRPLVAAVDVRGGGPGTRETDAVGLAGTVAEAHALVLSGGSAFGLAAATGVQAWLAERGVGFAIGAARVPLVPQAVLFDLLNGGDKAWGPRPPYELLGAKPATRRLRISRSAAPERVSVRRRSTCAGDSAAPRRRFPAASWSAPWLQLTPSEA